MDIIIGITLVVVVVLIVKRDKVISTVKNSGIAQRFLRNK